MGPSYRTIFEPPPINFVHDHFFNNFQLSQYLFRVRLGYDTFWTERCDHGLGKDFLGRALRLGQDRGPSAAVTFIKLTKCTTDF